MTDILPFPNSSRLEQLFAIPDTPILPVTLQFRERAYGMYKDYEPHNPKAKQMLRLMRKRNAQYGDLVLMEEIGFVVEVLHG